jgi:thiamine-monophosphate kinase
LLSRLQPEEAAAKALIARHEYPVPRVALGFALRGIASACIDVSDGLAAAATRLAVASGCGLTLDVEALPLSPALRAATTLAQAREFALQGGEDYELLFAVPEARIAALEAAASAVGDITCIGRLEAQPGLRLRTGTQISAAIPGGYDHFRA